MKRLLTGALIFCASIALASQRVESVPGEFIVKLKRNAQLRSQSLQSLSQKLGVQVKDVLTRAGDTVLVSANDVVALSQNANVEYVEPNFIYRIVGSPNDTMYTQLWGLNNTGQAIKDGKGNETRGVAGVDIGAEKAWEITQAPKT